MSRRTIKGPAAPASVSLAEARAAIRRPSKYRAVRTTVDGIAFASKKEAKRYAELRLMEKAGEIRDLTRQQSFAIEVNGQKVCGYTADFSYREKQQIAGAPPSGFQGTYWPLVVEDTKGFKTPVYRLKKKLMKAVYGIEIRET